MLVKLISCFWLHKITETRHSKMLTLTVLRGTEAPSHRYLEVVVMREYMRSLRCLSHVHICGRKAKQLLSYIS